ncbi:YbjN domain-containing protein [Mycobacterium intracellulare]|uniref:YbjN domain-containing protein n=1 Tax=Mycobacterium intracellulare TaxID=1767 RepID=UPI001EED3684|nr:YbjN domain-containing protein [Mycobacterium intracellulare]MEE3751568.1 YbjN domain-containing protein [Mycobacterium intracellulare]
MQIEPLSTELIERYLTSHGLRFFRSDDGEEFLVLSSYERGKLHVILRINGLRRDLLEISISPAAYYPAGERPRLMELVNDWNRDTHWPKAFVRETARPDHVSVVGENAYLLSDGIHFEALGHLVKSAVEYGADLFAKIEQAVRLPSADALEEWMDRTG